MLLAVEVKNPFVETTSAGLLIIPRFKQRFT